MKPVVESNKLERGEVWGEDDPSVHWAGAFAVYGGHGTTQSSTIVYEIEPGHRLGWHTDATEETDLLHPDVDVGRVVSVPGKLPGGAS